MANKSSKKETSTITLPRMTTLALKGKQSVRTSFKLSEGCIHAINIVATQLGIKHRSLFDYMVEDTRSLEALAKEIVKKESNENKGFQKSFIVSRQTLLVIDSLCKKLKVSRNSLIELSVRRLLPIIEKEMKNHLKREEMFELVDKHYQESRKVLNLIKKGVGTEDPAYKTYQTTVIACKQVRKQYKEIISKSKVIEGFDPDSLKD